MTKVSNKRILYIDILNILAILAVIALHHNGIAHTFKNTIAWKTSLFAECLFYWAVPLFLMLTGATLMTYRKKYDTKTFFKKRITKTFIPFLVWSCFMILWRIVLGDLKVEDFSIHYVLNLFLTNQSQSVYYFMYLIFGVYLTLPLISHLADSKYRKTLWYAVFVFFIFNATLPPVCSIFHLTYDNNFSLKISYGVFYAILGYLLSIEKISKKHRIVIYIFGVSSMLLRYFYTLYFSLESQKLVKTLFGYGQFHSILLVAMVFLFIKNINFNFIGEKASQFISKVSSCSFGIFLIHMTIMHYEKRILHLSGSSILWRTGCVFITYFLSLSIIYMMKKIPIVKKIVP